MIKKAGNIFLLCLSLLAADNFIFFYPDGDVRKLSKISARLKVIMPKENIIIITRYKKFIESKNSGTFGCIAPIFNSSNIMAWPVQNGSGLLKKNIVVKNGHTLSGASRVVSVDYGPNTAAILSKIIGKKLKLIVTVSKDIDALMAIKFGKADVAVVTKENFERMRSILSSSMSVLSDSATVLLPPLILYDQKKKLLLENLINDLMFNELLGFEKWRKQ